MELRGAAVLNFSVKFLEPEPEVPLPWKMPEAGQLRGFWYLARYA